MPNSHSHGTAVTGMWHHPGLPWLDRAEPRLLLEQEKSTKTKVREQPQARIGGRNEERWEEDLGEGQSLRNTFSHLQQGFLQLQPWKTIPKGALSPASSSLRRKELLQGLGGSIPVNSLFVG